MKLKNCLEIELRGLYIRNQETCSFTRVLDLSVTEVTLLVITATTVLCRCKRDFNASFFAMSSTLFGAMDYLHVPLSSFRYLPPSRYLISSTLQISFTLTTYLPS